MKILQVTHFGTTTNYGAVLQAFALQQALRLLGHTTILLKADFSYYNKLKKWNKSPMIAIKAWFRKKMTEREERRHPRFFNKFIQKYLTSTEQTYHTMDEVNGESWDSFDAFVTGSDQVWSDKSPSDLYFLNFGPEKTLRFSYAASVGTNVRASSDYIKAFRHAVRNFSGISVRENAALELCEKAGVPAVLVPDPVLLFSMNDYEDFFHLAPIQQEGKKCFCYFVGKKTNLPMNEIDRYITDQQLIPTAVKSQNCSTLHHSRYPEITPDIPGWLGNIRDAELILTDSFHGTIFSLLFGKRVIIFPKKEYDARFDMLERTFGIGSAIYRGDFRKAAEFQFPYTEIQKKITELRKQGFDFLTQTLS